MTYDAQPDWLEAWIDREFTGYGTAIRERSDPPIPGEPFMSMAVAKQLTRRAVVMAIAGDDPDDADRMLANLHKSKFRIPEKLRHR